MNYIEIPDNVAAYRGINPLAKIIYGVLYTDYDRAMQPGAGPYCLEMDLVPYLMEWTGATKKQVLGAVKSLQRVNLILKIGEQDSYGISRVTFNSPALLIP